MHQRFPFIALHAGALCACLLGLAPVGSAQGLTSSDLSKLFTGPGDIIRRAAPQLLLLSVGGVQHAAT